MIRLEKVTKSFDLPGGVVTAVDGIDMDVPEGEVCVLLGPSGCGKSTTLRMVNRLIAPTSGRILIGGEDTSKIDPVALRRRIGYVIQQVGLFPNMTVAENISVVPRLLGWPEAKMRARVDELLAMVSLDPGAFARRYPHELSGGQAQRIGVARALAADPPLLLMDEPFGALDPVSRASLQEEFRKLQRRLGKTILFVSHDLDEALILGDRIALFRSGRIEQIGTPDAVLGQPASPFVEAFIGSDRALRRLRLITAAEVATDPKLAVVAGDPVARAAELMALHHLPGIAVLDGNGRPVGGIDAARLHGTDGTCGALMRPLTATASGTDDLRQALTTMLTHGAGWLACVDDDGRFVGAVIHSGIARRLAQTGTAT